MTKRTWMKREFFGSHVTDDRALVPLHFSDSTGVATGGGEAGGGGEGAQMWDKSKLQLSDIDSPPRRGSGVFLIPRCRGAVATSLTSSGLETRMICSGDIHTYTLSIARDAPPLRWSIGHRLPLAIVSSPAIFFPTSRRPRRLPRDDRSPSGLEIARPPRGISIISVAHNKCTAPLNYRRGHEKGKIFPRRNRRCYAINQGVYTLRGGAYKTLHISLETIRVSHTPSFL